MAVQVAIPAGAIAAVLSTWIKGHFSVRAARSIEITTKDGATFRITGYEEEEIQRLVMRIADQSALE